MSKARLPNLFGIRALFISTFPPEKKKKKKEHTLWKLEEMKPLHELSQKRTSLPRSQIVCSAVFLTSKHSVFLHKGFHGHVEFLMQKKVRETETLFLTEWAIGEKKSGREGEKENTSCMSPLLTPTSQTQNQSHGGSVNDLKLPSETPVLKESFWCVCQMPFPPLKRRTVM